MPTMGEMVADAVVKACGGGEAVVMDRRVLAEIIDAVLMVHDELLDCTRITEDRRDADHA